MKKFLLIFSITATVLYSQENNITLSGELLYDSQIVSSIIQIENKIEQQSGVDNRKSPLLAAALSFALPGAGEFYSEQYLKSAIFIAAEIAAIAVGLIYDKKGDDQTESFQNYAHTHWDVKRYARWTIKNAASINPLVNSAEYSVFDNNGNVVWSELNRLESAIGKYYSHRLAPYRDQQYYEMIGKYPQFNVGWDDFGDENTPFIYGDPLTSNFLFYSGERGKANDYYNIASTAVIVIVANHILSAVDAAWSAASFNKSLLLSSEIKKVELGFRTFYFPQLNLRYNF
ncbi:MAG TPA: hypothetical protein PLZ15_07960 [Melioribacteraceae bacterium]|nr:hypothetical protein [Melioribacteraceae bacterium]